MKESRGCKQGEALVEGGGGCIVENCIESGLLALIGELVMHEPEIPTYQLHTCKLLIFTSQLLN